jgi:DNA-3-methyladenine glycosylase II
MTRTFTVPTPHGLLWPRVLQLAGQGDRDWVNRVQQSTFIRLFTVGARLVLLRCETEGEKLRVTLDVEGAAAIEPELTRHFERLLVHMFALDVTWKPVAAVLGTDPVLAPFLADVHDFRPFRPPSNFEALVDAVLGQQVHRDFAMRLRNHVVESFGASRRVGGEVYYAFPTPARLARASTGLLRELQLSSRKADFVLELARRFCRRVDLSGEPRADLTRLRKLPGIGQWSGEYALMQGMGVPDIVPAGDAFLQATVGLLYGLGDKATEEQVRKVALGWQPYRSWGTYFIWYGMSPRPDHVPASVGSC